MVRLSTPLLDILSSDANTYVFTPLTGALSTAELRHVRFEAWLDAPTGLKVAPGLQFSDDGFTWGSVVELTAIYSTVSVVGWMRWMTFLDLFDTGTYSPKLFVRFGMCAKNVTGTATNSAQCRLVVEGKPVVGDTLLLGPAKVNTKGASGTGDWVFIALSEPMPTEEMGEVRVTRAA